MSKSSEGQNAHAAPAVGSRQPALKPAPSSTNRPATPKSAAVTPTLKTASAASATPSAKPTSAIPSVKPISAASAPAAKPVSATTSPKPTSAASAPKPTSAQPSTGTPLNFRYEDAGKWTAKQESPFAAQNRRDAEQRAKRTANLKKAKPFIIAASILGAIALLIGVVIILIVISQPSPPSFPSLNMGVSDLNPLVYAQKLENLYNSEDLNITQMEAGFEETVAENQGYAAQLSVSMAAFLVNIQEYDRALAFALQTDETQLTIMQRINLYQVLSYIYSGLGDSEAAVQYFEMSFNLSIESGVADGA